MKNLILGLTIVSLFAIACGKDNTEPVKPAPVTPTPTFSFIDLMSDGFDVRWNQDLSGGGRFIFDGPQGVFYAAINNATASATGRAEVSRRLTAFTNADKKVIIKGKYLMALTAEDNKPNEGGWVLQTLAWGYKDPRDSTVYKPLVVARIRPNLVDYLVYDYDWNATNRSYQPKSGFPVSRTIKAESTFGKTYEIQLTINFSKNQSTGYVRANLNGADVPSANYVGATYPSIFPDAFVQWKGGCYSSFAGIFNSKIGLYYLATDQPQQ